MDAPQMPPTDPDPMTLAFTVFSHPVMMLP